MRYNGQDFSVFRFEGRLLATFGTENLGAIAIVGLQIKEELKGGRFFSWRGFWGVSENTHFLPSSALLYLLFLPQIRNYKSLIKLFFSENAERKREGSRISFNLYCLLGHTRNAKKYSDVL